MNLLHRTLLTIYSLSLAIISMIVLLVSLNVIRDENVYYIIDSLYRDLNVSIVTALVSLIVFLLSIWFLSTAFRRSKKASGIHQIGEHGDIVITIDTLESIAARAAKKVKGVRELKARVKSGESDSVVRIGLRITVDGETSIPEISELLQHNVKAHTEEITGITVESVTVVVENTIQSTSTKGRVE